MTGIWVCRSPALPVEDLMTQLLIRLFIRRPDQAQDPDVRTAYGNLAGAVGMVCNLLLCVGKLTVGTLFGSIAIMADALNNLSDASSNVVSLIGFRLAARAPDAEHPYGHARYEYLAGLVVSVTILGIGFSLLKESVVKVFHPTPVAFSWLSVGVLAASILVKLWMSGFNRTIGRTIGSETLMATAADSRNDVLTTGAVLISTVVCSLTGWARLDGIMGVAVAAFILWSGWGLVMDTLSPLLGESPSPELVEHIEQTVMGYPGVLGMHDLMVHDYGPGRRFASVHAEIDHRIDPLIAHEILDEIERQAKKDLHVDLVIHYDPIVTDDPEVCAVRTRVLSILHAIDPRLSFHDFRMVSGPHHVNVIFDMVIPPEYADRTEQLRKQVEAQLQDGKKTYHLVVTFDTAAFNALSTEAGE